MCDSDGINAEKSAEKSPLRWENEEEETRGAAAGGAGGGSGSKDDVPGRRG